MSVRDRFDDAMTLWECGRFEGALLVALIAAAATSRRRYPHGTKGDREAFESFLEEDMRVPIGRVEYRGELHTVQHIFYKWLRCELVHEGAVPIDIRFTGGEQLSIRAGGAPEYVLQLSKGWLRYLLNAIAEAPENQNDFVGRKNQRGS